METLLDTVITRLKASPPGTSKVIAQKTGIAYDTIRRICRGSIKNPRVGTLERMKAALAEL